MGFLVKLTESTRKSFIESLATKAIKDLMAKTESASDTDTGTFRVIISSDDQDRQGEKVSQDGLDFTQFMKSPVVLWGHDYNQPPVGICTRIWREGNQTLGEGKFAPTPFAQNLRSLYDLGMLRAVSIGFIPKELDEDGNSIKGEVLEFSFVSVPANPYALSLDHVKSYNLDMELLKSKGLTFNLSEKSLSAKELDEKQNTPEFVELKNLLADMKNAGIKTNIK